MTYAGERSGFGQMVEINHGNGLATRYCHNEKLLVKQGDMVRKGQDVALMGSTGRLDRAAPALRSAEERRSGRSAALYRRGSLSPRLRAGRAPRPACETISRPSGLSVQYPVFSRTPSACGSF